MQRRLDFRLISIIFHLHHSPGMKTTTHPHHIFFCFSENDHTFYKIFCLLARRLTRTVTGDKLLYFSPVSQVDHNSFRGKRTIIWYSWDRGEIGIGGREREREREGPITSEWSKWGITDPQSYKTSSLWKYILFKFTDEPIDFQTHHHALSSTLPTPPPHMLA